MLVTGSCECSIGVALMPCQVRGEIQACHADGWNPSFKNHLSIGEQAKLIRQRNRRAVAPKVRRGARCIPLAPLVVAAESSLQLWGSHVGMRQVESRRKPNIYFQPDFQKC